MIIVNIIITVVTVLLMFVVQDYYKKYKIKKETWIDPIKLERSILHEQQKYSVDRLNNRLNNLGDK
jgi:cell division protein FtsL